MTSNKDLKRVVRARMKKTGEAYTAARAQVTRKSRAGTQAAAVAAPPPVAVSPPKQDYATLAGMSDAVIKEKTGCTWDKWVKSLDYHGAREMSHGDIATLVNEKYKVDGWWSQSVTVGYERIKGLRVRGQRRDGSYEVGKSRTFNVPVTTLFNAWADASLRRRWLDGAGVKVRTATPPKSMRLGWTDGTIVVVGFIDKGTAKSSVALAHTKIPDRETADGLKQYWSERLDALGDVVTQPVRASGGTR
ncbi:MAG: hypothetical protein H0T48_11285 [Gemmatimonadaceae bacterium]|nr:hypothetical protein [Gemmatimonadaceae bacterium]